MRINKYKCDHCGSEIDLSEYGVIRMRNALDFCHEECLYQYLHKQRQPKSQPIEPFGLGEDFSHAKDKYETK